VRDNDATFLNARATGAGRSGAGQLLEHSNPSAWNDRLAHPEQKKRNGIASARTFYPGYSIGRILSRTIRMKGAYQPSIALRGEQMLRTTFAMLRRAFPMLRTVILATFNERCCECVANEVTCNI
jgi:hypothetical protein